MQSGARYRLGETLGSGGQGRTYRAVDRDSGEVVAVKVIQLSSADGWKPFDLFERECAVLEALDHWGIPRYRNTYAIEEEGKYCLVMELVQGRSLQRLLEDQRPVDESQLWNILHQVLEILDYLHSRHPPVVHRDIKPDNILRRDDATIALVDFGGVRVAIRPEGGSTVVGTFGYMAPEQLHGEASAATDIYGLGATMVALATATAADKLPRKGLKIDVGAVMADSRLRDVLGKMLEPDPDKRLASVAAVRRAIGPGDKKRRRASARSQPPQRAPAEPTDDLPATQASDEDEAVGPFMLRMLASLGYVGVLFVEAVFLPMLFFVARRLSKPAKHARLKEREHAAREMLNRGRKSMKELTQHKRRRRLPEGRGAGPPLPPGQSPPRGRRGRGRGRHRRR